MESTDRLTQLKKAVERSQTVKAAVEQAKTYREALEKKITALKESCFLEEQDVSILEEDKAYALLLSLRGKLSGRMEKEKAEALAVKLKYEQSQKELSDLNGDIAALEQEQAGLAGCEPEYKQLFEQKTQRLMREGNANSQRITELSENLARAESAYEEMCKALKSGDKTLKLLDYVIEDLKRADTFDSEYNTMNLEFSRHEYLNRAAECTDKAQKFFNAFKAAAANINAMNDVSVTTGFLVADILFEDLTANWKELNSMGKTRTTAETVRSEIFCDVLKLRQLSDEAKSALSGLETRLDALVLGTAE